MGPELAPLALPLGHHKDLLLIGAEDAMLAQELHLLSGEILERVNAFMECPFFSAVKVSLTLDKTVLTEKAARGTGLGGVLSKGEPSAQRSAALKEDAARPRGNFLGAHGSRFARGSLLCAFCSPRGFSSSFRK